MSQHTRFRFYYMNLSPRPRKIRETTARLRGQKALVKNALFCWFVSATIASAATPVPTLTPTPTPTPLLAITPTAQSSIHTAYTAKVKIELESFTELRLKEGLYTTGGRTPLSFGSGLSVFTNSKGQTVFLGLTDRGPNILAPEDLGRSKTYLLSEHLFAPSLVPFVIDGKYVVPITWSRFLGLGDASKEKHPAEPSNYSIPLLTSVGEVFDGIPPSDSGQESVTPELIPISPTGRGIDPEGITLLPNVKQMWISEEYGPSILVFDLFTRRLIRRLDPGHGLPEIVSKRKMNRGFEGIAALPGGSVVTALQSPLSINGSEEDCLRIVIIPSDGNPTSVGMPLGDLREYTDYKLSDLATAGDTVLIAVESYEDKDTRKYKNLIAIDLSTAGNNSSTTCSSSFHLKSVQRRVILDMSLLGEKFGKIEGLTLLPDKRTLLFTEDTDFGLHLKKKSKKSSDRVIPGSAELLSVKDSQTRIYRIVFRNELSYMAD